MSIPVKFRIWDNKDKRWLDEWLLIDKNGKLFVCCKVTGEITYINWDVEVTKFTGFKDKNDKEIYFGDIYKLKLYNHYRVVTDIIVAHWVIDEDKCNNPMRDVEICGNKFEHPYLLDKKTILYEKMRFYGKDEELR